MTLEELKLRFCKNEELIKELKTKYQNLSKKLKELTKEINESKEYQQYINDTETEEKRLKLINTEIYKEFLKTKQEVDIIKEKINEEEMKLTEQEFEELLNKAQCNHLFYNVDDEEKVCIKCNHVEGTKETIKPHDIKELRLSFLYTELSSTSKKEENLSEILQNEELQHLNLLTKMILSQYPNIDNEKLKKQLEEKVSEANMKYINAMYENIEDMPEDTKKSYIKYQNTLKK